MSKRPARKGGPYAGRRVYLGGEITRVEENALGQEVVTVRLDKWFTCPVTIVWEEPVDVCIVSVD